jgi:AICAR transformylase/IMP cyclohydrolase PurH
LQMVKPEIWKNPHQKDSSLVILTPCLINYTEKISYNNLLDVDAAVTLISEFKTDDLLSYIKHITLWPCYKKNDKWRVQRC